MPIILLHIGQDKWHVEHKRCYGICCTVTYTKRTLGHIRRNAHTCQYRNKNERHKSPFSCGRYHKEIDQRRKKNEENQYPNIEDEINQKIELAINDEVKKELQKLFGIYY